jgi:uncharacterized protein
VGPASPVPAAARIVALDLLRGFALFGVLWSNLNDWYGTTGPISLVDKALSTLQYSVIESRFYSILGVVFGVGFAIQLGKAAEPGATVAVFRRRMLALLAFGIAHVLLLWSGDILIQYALLGFILVLFRDLQPRQIVKALGVIWLVVPYVIALIRRTLHLQMVPFPPQGLHDWLYANGSWSQIFSVRIGDWLNWYGRWPFTVFPNFLVLFLFGLWAWRTGMVDWLGDRRFLKRCLVISFGMLGLSLALGLPIQAIWPWPEHPPTDWHTFAFWNPVWNILGALGDLLTWGVAGVYASLLLLAATRQRGARVLAPLATLGRMPLTTYLTQSLVCTTLFYGFGSGWYGKVGWSGMLMITCTLFAAQIVFSGWWLARYRFGPAEWLWRTLAYGRRQPMRISPAPAVSSEPLPLPQ